MKISKYHLLLIGIVLLGLFLRVYQLRERFAYGYDHELASWVVRDVVVNKHFRLIGQETSTQGVYIGPVYYYLAIPFYLLAKMDPIALPIYSAFWGVFGILSFYLVFSKVFGKRAGLLAALISAVSFYIVTTDRDPVPTQPVIAWTVWYFYSLNLIITNNQKKAFILLGVLIGLIWSVNFSLVLLLPLILICFLLAKKKPELKALLLGSGVTLFLSLPLILFEVRHNFGQFKHILLSLTTQQSDTLYHGLSKVVRVLYLANKVFSNFLWGSSPLFGYSYIYSIILVGVFLFLFFRKIIDRKIGVILSLWVLLFLGFFSTYSKIVTEYYLDGLIVFFIATFVLSLDYLFKEKKTYLFGAVVLTFFTALNLYAFFSLHINESGYVERKAVINDIKVDSAKHGFDCVSLSYLTSPGNNLGYRYFGVLANLTTKKIGDKVPVYSIVYPKENYYKLDKSFGAIGVIYPDYSRYNIEALKKDCGGENYNLTEPVWGLPQ